MSHTIRQKVCKSCFLGFERLNVHRIKKDALFIIDGSYLLYRSFYAIKTLQTSSGQEVQAVFGFCRTINKLLEQFDPHYLVVAWDSRGKNFRHELYAEYKATRMAPPVSLAAQRELIWEYLDTVGIFHVQKEGFEADDVIASLVSQEKDEHQIVLVCADKDMYQLLDQGILIYDPFKEKLIDAHDFKTERGYGPEKVALYHALLGDSSDNIPGVQGIGEKTATELVKQFDSLDDMYENLSKISREKVRQNLEQFKDDAYLSYKLFLLKTPHLNLDEKKLAFDKTGLRHAAQLFARLEFKALLKDLKAKFPENTGQEQNISLFGGQEPESKVQVDETVIVTKKHDWETIVIQDQETLDKFITEFKNVKRYALDTETFGSNVMQDGLVGISIAWDESCAYYFPVAHKEGKQVPKNLVIDALKPLLQDTSKYVIMHHAKFDQLVLYQEGIAMPIVDFDTLLAANLVRGEGERISLKHLSVIYLQESMETFKQVVGKHETFADVSIEHGAPYAAFDALQTLRIEPIIKKKLEQEKTLERVYYDIELLFYPVLMSMEYHGILVDVDQLKNTLTAVKRKIAHIEEKIFAAIGTKSTLTKDHFNLRSTNQMAKLLFDDLGLPVIRKSQTGKRSTDYDVLLELSKQHPIPRMIIEYRELEKLKGTYLEPLPTFVNSKTGRIHTSFSQTLVATGRLASSDPNLQNVPTTQGFGMEIRKAFIAPHGKRFLSADYSQIELRILAHMTQDEELIHAFQTGVDIHAKTAAQLFDVPLENVTHDQRQIGKRINFSIMYGISPFGLANDLGIEQKKAKEYIEKYFEQYPKVAAWMEKTVQEAVKKGYVETLFGRRRIIKEVQEQNRTLFEAGKRMAINTPVQGTQAELMKLAMIHLHDEFCKKGLEARMILQIHDELIVELPLGEVEIVEKTVKKCMEGVVSWEIPLLVSTRTGRDWAEITK
jgi:DNA polymerase-1